MEAAALALLVLAAGPVLFGLWHWCATVRAPAIDNVSGAVTLVLPLAPGSQVGPLLAALAVQSLPPRRIIIAVENADDAPAGMEVAVAGTATGRGQKSHNLLAALALIDARDQVVVFLDADILPTRGWLAFLAGPVLRGERDVVGGYRWSIPHGPMAQAVAWLDRGWALNARVPALDIAWGGSLAFSSAHLATVRRGLGHGLSDDLGIAAAARADGLRLLIRGALLVPSPLEGPGVVEFWTRQLRILRFYRPRLWAAQMIYSHAVLAAWVMLWGSAALLGAMAMQATRSLAQDVAARRLGMPDAPGTRAWQALFALLPLPDLLNLFCLWSSAIGTTLTWRGITYAVAPDGAAHVVSRA